MEENRGGGKVRGTACLILVGILPVIVKAAVLASGTSGYAGQSLYKIVQIAAVLLAWRSIASAAPGDWKGGIRSGLILGIAGIALVKAAEFSGLIDTREVKMALDARFSPGMAGAFGIVVFLATLNAALEEAFYRALIDRGISRRLGTRAGVAAGAALFGAIHAFIFAGLLPPAAIILMVAAITTAGVVWSQVMRRSGLLAAITSHGLTDAIILGWGLVRLGYY